MQKLLYFSIFLINQILGLIGNQFGNLGNDEICGIVFSAKSHEDVISVWNKNADDQNLTAQIRCVTVVEGYCILGEARYILQKLLYYKNADDQNLTTQIRCVTVVEGYCFFCFR